jgi:uncharacterized membrane protein YcaP (DUF421 family)
MEIVVRATVIFFFLWVLTRSLGKRELAEMTAFELVVLVVMGDLVQQAVTQEDMSLAGAFLAVGTIALWVGFFSWVGFRFRRARPVVEGSAQIIVREGEPQLELMRIERVTLDEVLEAARNQGIADLAMVRIGILEPDGRFSFLRYDGDEPQSDGGDGMRVA